MKESAIPENSIMVSITEYETDNTELGYTNICIAILCQFPFTPFRDMNFKHLNQSSAARSMAMLVRNRNKPRGSASRSGEASDAAAASIATRIIPSAIEKDPVSVGAFPVILRNVSCGPHKGTKKTRLAVRPNIRTATNALATSISGLLG